MPLRTRTKRILVIKSRAIGDTVLLTGPLRLLRRRFPDHEIHVLVRSPAGELIEGLPYVDRIISAFEPKARIERLAYWLRLLRRLRETSYELVLNFHASFRSSLTAQLLRVDTCVANHHELKGRNWFSDILVPGRGQVKPVIDRDLDVLRAIGITAEVEDAMPEIVLSTAEVQDARALLEREKFSGMGPYIFLGVGGSRGTKRWPPAYFAAVARRLVAEFDARLVIASIASDRGWLDEFWPLVRPDEKLAGRIAHFSDQTLRQTAKIVSQCQTYVGNDSGLKHVAVALGLKTFTVFGPEAPHEWHPYDRRRHPYVFIENLSCRTESGKHWCSIPTCLKHGHRCMQDISPDAAWSEISRIVREP